MQLRSSIPCVVFQAQDLMELQVALVLLCYMLKGGRLRCICQNGACFGESLLHPSSGFMTNLENLPSILTYTVTYSCWWPIMINGAFIAQAGCRQLKQDGTATTAPHWDADDRGYVRCAENCWLSSPAACQIVSILWRSHASNDHSHKVLIALCRLNMR